MVFQVSFGSSRGEAGGAVSQSLQSPSALSAFAGEAFGMHNALRRKLQGGISSSRTHQLCCQTPPPSDILTIKLALLSLWRWEASSRLHGFWLPASSSPPLTPASLQHALPYTHLSWLSSSSFFLISHTTLLTRFLSSVVIIKMKVAEKYTTPLPKQLAGIWAIFRYWRGWELNRRSWATSTLFPASFGTTVFSDVLPTGYLWNEIHRPWNQWMLWHNSRVSNNLLRVRPFPFHLKSQDHSAFDAGPGF